MASVDLGDSILFVVAMEAEAAPIRAALGLDGPSRLLHERFPATITLGNGVAVATNGADPRFGVDSIATQPAVTTTLHAIEQFEPTLVVSAGTAGGFAAAGGGIGTVYLANHVVFHDRRVALPGFDRYGVGSYPVADVGPAIHRIRARAPFPIGVGTVSSGNALDTPEVDRANMLATKTVAKDMEAAAVAWVCERMNTPFTALKAVTDLVDSSEATAEQFVDNLAVATEHLALAASRLVAALTRPP